VPPQDLRCAENFYKKIAYSYVIVRKRQFLSFIIDSFIQHASCLFSYACIVIGQVFICRYIFMLMYSFVSPFREAKFCGVPPCVFDKSGSAAGEKVLRNTGVEVFMSEKCLSRVY
jgi:hypothetical protein